jgi:hypothetical protein
VAAFAQPTDVSAAYEGLSPPLPGDTRVQYLLDVASARLRALLPTLEQRIADADSGDLALLAKDVVVQAVIRRAQPTGAQASSQTQQAGPFQTTVRFAVDRTGWFTDDDLAMLAGIPRSGLHAMGTIKLGLVDWANQ